MDGDRGGPDEILHDEVLGVPVRRDRMPVARLLVRACEGLGYLRPEARKKPLRALGDGTGRSPQLFAGWLVSTGWPEIETLLDLQEKAGITLEEWLVAFGLLAPRAIAARTIADVSPARQELIRLTDGWTEDDVRVVAALVRLAVARRREDRNRAARPTDEDTSQ